MIMRIMKKMRPEELGKICTAAAEMKKSKIEDQKKVAEFVEKTPELANLIENCYICMEPLLNNIGTPKFGVLSWHCRCTVAQTAHSACLFPKICSGESKCDMCSSPMLFESPRGNRNEATIKVIQKNPRATASTSSRYRAADD